VTKRRRKAPLTDPRRAGLEAVEQETADEAEILRDIDASDNAPAPPAGAKKTSARNRKRKKS
jgi:hypothetical protein